jgi:hypothetical protein
VSNIIRRCIDHMKLAAYMAFSFITFFLFLSASHFFITVFGCMFCVLPFNFVNYVFLLLCLCILIVVMSCSVYSVFIVFFYVRVLFVCKCVLYCTVLYCCHRVSTQLQFTDMSPHHHNKCLCFIHKNCYFLRPSSRIIIQFQCAVHHFSILVHFHFQFHH